MDNNQTTPELEQDNAAAETPVVEQTPLALTTSVSLKMVAFTAGFVALMAATYEATLPNIEASQREEKLKLINDVLPPASYNNELLTDTVLVLPTKALGNGDTFALYRARQDDKPVALVLEATAPDGYSGNIGLIIAVGSDGFVSGVRVTTHKETPGLGDYIDPAKDKNKAQPWISQFAHLHYADMKASDWSVKKDNGQFTYHAGATISPRAVSRAVGRAVSWASQHQAQLFALPHGATFAPAQEQ